MKCRKDFRRFPLLALFAATSFLVTIHPAALAQDGPAEPTIRKDSIIASIYPNFSRTEWRVDFKFEVNTPFTREDRLWVDVLYPGRKDRITHECRGDTAGENKADFRCEDTDPHYATTAGGVVDFEIHMANELSGKNLVLFRGKMKVVKGPENPGRPAEYFHVDEDWRIPIGYLYRDSAEHLNFAVWWFGESMAYPETTAHLFHEGKAIAKADCQQQPLRCSFRTDGIDPVPALSPGAYEIKLIKEGRLRRTATFTVNPDGSYDNGIASANKLGSDKVIIPVNVVGDLPRPWNKLAWKTEAFYGNPLTGFTAPP